MNLAIRGHATRGKEVIEILEMLGGRNLLKKSGHGIGAYLIMPSNNLIDYLLAGEIRDDLMIFTLEEFLEKFPYKVGDKVVYKPIQQINTVCISEIILMKWLDDSVVYYTSNGHEIYVCDLQPYKEQETMEETDEDLCVYDKLDFTRGPAADKVELVLGDYEIKEENGKTFLVKKQPQYPKTYEECCKVVGIHPLRKVQPSFVEDLTQYEKDLAYTLWKWQQLLICRDAYWKIAGDWRPDIMYGDLYCIGYSGSIITWKMQGGCRLLIFPTEEMRDAFYENFKELIEECKELL